MCVRAISLAVGLALALAAPAAAGDDGGPRDGGRPEPAATQRAPGDGPPTDADGVAGDGREPAPVSSEDEEILRDLEMLMLFDLLQDYDLFAEDEE
jgi:hypothetical protein